MSVVMLHSSRAARVIIVTACNSNNGQYAINLGNNHGMECSFQQDVLYRKATNTTKQLQKQTSVMYVPCLRVSKHLFAWRYPSAAVLIAPEDQSSLYLSRFYSPLIFAWSEFSTTNQTRRRRSKYHSTKNLDRTKASSKKRDWCRRIREHNMYMSQGKEGQSRTCPNANPLKWHGCKSHTAFKPMASNVQQSIGNVRIVCIQRVAKDHKHNRKSYAEGLQRGLLSLGKTCFGIQISV